MVILVWAEARALIANERTRFIDVARPIVIRIGPCSESQREIDANEPFIIPITAPGYMDLISVEVSALRFETRSCGRC